jgi:hypothetical protein
MNEDFQKRLNKYLQDCSAGKDHPNSLDLLLSYFQNNTGGQFETYGVNDPFSITSDDLIAVTMLSMEVKLRTKSGLSPQSALKIEAHAKQLSGYLQDLVLQIFDNPAELRLENLRTDQARTLLLDKESPAQMLIELLLELLSDPDYSPNIKRVAVSKLISRKHPSLFPIRDRKVANRLGYPLQPNSNDYLVNWWNDWHQALTSDLGFKIRGRLEELQLELENTKKLESIPSLIRIADVLIWSRCTCN